MNIIDRSAIDALRRMDEVRKAREDRMRNALEILTFVYDGNWPTTRALLQHVRAIAREGLGRDDS